MLIHLSTTMLTRTPMGSPTHTITRTTTTMRMITRMPMATPTSTLTPTRTSTAR